MKILYAITAASVLTVSAFANAETSLSQAEMDGVNAAGFSFADATAVALGVTTSAWTNTVTNVLSVGVNLGQFGAIFDIASDALAEASSDSEAQAVALATGFGNTEGTGLSDTTSNAATVTDMDAPTPFSMSYANNASIASSVIIGKSSSANSASSSAASLTN